MSANRLIQRRPYLIASITLALILVVLFGGLAAWRLARRMAGSPPPPRQADVSLIADWMSVPYVSRAYRVPESELYAALGVDREGRQVQSLRELAQETGRSRDEVVTIVRETVSAWQAAHPRPGPSELPPSKPGAPKPSSSRAPLVVSRAAPPSGSP